MAVPLQHPKKAIVESSLTFLRLSTSIDLAVLIAKAYLPSHSFGADFVLRC